MFLQWFIHFFMPLVTAYHLLSSNLFLNTATSEATGLEYWGNMALIPTQYLLAGEKVIPAGNYYRFEPRFDYQSGFFIKMGASLIALPLSLIIGSALKGLAYLNPMVQNRHRTFLAARSTVPPPHPDIEPYRRSQPSEKIASLLLARHPQASEHLAEEKKALQLIIPLLRQHEIPFWADCGTCLGAYRYGGVIPWDFDIDIAIFQLDFDRVKAALQALPADQCLVQDWSNRQHPKTLLKVYIRKTCEYIDIYHFKMNPERNTLEYILSHADNCLMPTSWKIRESRFTIETPIAMIFPLKLAPFDGLELPVPNQIEYYLQQRYGTDLSPAKYYDEASDTYIPDPNHPYWQRVHAH